MKHLITLSAALALRLLDLGLRRLAQDGARHGRRSAPMTKQQSKMGDCNRKPADKKGDERKAFMKTCLSDKPTTQQDKMKKCNIDATGKKGDERKAFMKSCLAA